MLCYRGFRILQRKRLILNTPTSKIRSAALGLVEVSGLATGPYLINAPVTGKSCYFYRTMAWELRKSGKNQEWQKVADESLHVPFYVDDTTGLLLVNPQGAETDLHRDFHEEYSNSFLSTSEMPLAVRSFLARYGVAGDHKVRIDEYCIKPKNALFILGTIAENPGIVVDAKPIQTQAAGLFRLEFSGARGNTGDGAGSTPKPFLPSLTVNTGTKRELINLSGNYRPASAAEMTQQGKIAAALLKAGISNPAAWTAAGIDSPSTAVALASGQESTTASGDTAGANQTSTTESFDLRPKVVLMKGENDPAFFISWRSQREIVSSLGWKAIAYIWGGPALTLISVYILLARLEWL